MNKKKQQMLGNLEIAAFCDQLSMIVSAGIPIDYITETDSYLTKYVY